jgi:GAF domain-containing protein
MIWSAIAPDAELIAFFEQHPAPLAADSSDLPSAVSSFLAAAKMSLLVPLVAQRQLVGLLSLGPLVTGGAYSADDFVFLSTLADEAAAAARIIRLLDDDARSQSPAGKLNGFGGVSSPTSS